MNLSVLLQAPFSLVDAITCVTLGSHFLEIVTPETSANSKIRFFFSKVSPEQHRTVFLGQIIALSAMELEDSLFPWLREVDIGTYPYEVFQDVEWSLLIGENLEAL